MSFPQISGPRLIRQFERLGFFIKRQTGGHAILVHREDASRRAVVPIHGNKPIRPGTLRSILEGARLTIDDIR